MAKPGLSRSSLRAPVVKAVTILEFILASIVVAGTAWYLFSSLEILLTTAEPGLFFAVFIDVLLTAIIGVEIARVLITHNLVGIVELLGFVMARKVLSPDVTATDLFVVTVAFGVLVYVRRWLIDQQAHDLDTPAIPIFK